MHDGTMHTSSSELRGYTPWTDMVTSAVDTPDTSRRLSEIPPWIRRARAPRAGAGVSPETADAQRAHAARYIGMHTYSALRLPTAN